MNYFNTLHFYTNPLYNTLLNMGNKDDATRKRRTKTYHSNRNSST